MNTSSTSPSKTLITAEPKPKARKRMESASASTAPSWMSFTGWRSAKRSTARSTSCRPTLMCGSPNTTSTGPIRVAGALARPRCRPFLTRYHWQRKNSWRHDHTRQPYRPHCQHRLSDQVSANTEYGLRPDLLAVTHLYEEAGVPKLIVAAKGAPEAIAELCQLPERDRVELRRGLDEMAQEGMRVLAVARASVPAGLAHPETPREFPFEFLGLVGLADPLRPTVPAAVQECRTAGIRVIMITGDYPQTARAIASQASLEAGDVVTGTELEAMSEADLKERVRSTTIFARTMPEQKLRIVDSLKAAHIGIAMGGRGTDVAREAASLILLDDDFTSIVATVRLGSRIYANLP